MKTIRTFIASFILIFSSTYTFASCSPQACVTKIKRLYLTGGTSGSILVMPTEVAQGYVNCTLKEGHYLTLKNDHPLFSEIYSTLLAIKIAEKNVRIRIVEESNNCEISYIWLD